MDSRKGEVITLLPETSKPPLRATQSLIQLVLGAPSLHVKRRSCDPDLSLQSGAIHRLPNTPLCLMKHAGLCGRRRCCTCKTQAVDLDILYFRQDNDS